MDESSPVDYGHVDSCPPPIAGFFCPKIPLGHHHVVIAAKAPEVPNLITSAKRPWPHMVDFDSMTAATPALGHRILPFTCAACFLKDSAPDFGSDVFVLQGGTVAASGRRLFFERIARLSSSITSFGRKVESFDVSASTGLSFSRINST